jgi:hypothetical protein
MRFGSLMRGRIGHGARPDLGQGEGGISSHRIRSQDSASSSPPPQQMPLTAQSPACSGSAIPATRQSRPRHSRRRPHRPAAAAFRSQPGQKNFSPSARMMQMRRLSSSRKSRKVSPMIRLVARLDGIGLGAVQRHLQDRALPRRCLIGPSVASAWRSCYILPDHGIHRHGPFRRTMMGLISISSRLSSASISRCKRHGTRATAARSAFGRPR